MPRFTADAALAAYAQRAAQVLRRSNQAALPSGMTTTMPTSSRLDLPASLRAANRVNQLQGAATRMDPNVLAQLKRPTLQAASRADIYAAAGQRALAAQQAAADASGQNSIDDFTRGYFGATGWRGSDESLRARAQQYAPSYGGQTFAAHNIAQEGQVSYQGGVPGVMVKFTAPGQGSDTRWVPLG